MGDIINDYLGMMKPVFYGPYEERIGNIGIEVNEDEISASRYLDFITPTGSHAVIKVVYTVQMKDGIPPKAMYPTVMEGLDNRANEEIEHKESLGYKFNWK
jgi:hypothetical protein